MIYTLTADDVASGASLDTYLTVLAAIVADTAGYRVRLRELVIGASDDAPSDLNIGVRIQRVKDISSGTAGTKTSIVAADIEKSDTLGIDPNFTGGRAYTVEPTVYANEPLYQVGFNIRGGHVAVWSAMGAPTAARDQLLACRITPRTNAAIKVCVTMKLEHY